MSKKNRLAKSTQSTQVEVAEMTRNFFRAPNPVKVLIPIIVLSYLMGFMLTEFGDLYQSLYFGTVLFLLPVIIAALLAKPLVESLGGRLFIRRSMLLGFMDIMMIFIFLLVYILFFKTVDTLSYLIFAFGSTLWLRHVVFVSTSNSNHLRSLPSTLVYPLLCIIITAIIIPPFTLNHLLLSVIIILIFLLAAVIFLENANVPLRRAFGINSLTMFRHVLDQSEEEEDEAEKMETAFTSFSAPIDAFLGVVSFRTRDGIKLLMVVPSIHPGPFGYVGGSNLPYKLKSELSTIADTVFVPHGPCTHDFNPPSGAECSKISVKVKELLKDIEYTPEVGSFVRKTNHANVCVQPLGDSALVLVSLAPNPTDDLDFATGYAIREKVKGCGYKDSLVIDAHNCLLPGSGLVHFGTKTSANILKTAQLSASAALETESGGLRIGVAERGNLGIGSMGQLGIQVLVLEVHGQKTAYILLDGNNLIPGFREELIKDAKGIVDEAEVLTTDNHVANVSYGSFNPVGLHGKKEIAVLSKELVSKAVEDLEDAEVGMKTGIISGFKVFGHESATRLATIISSTVSSLRVSAFLSLLVSYSLSVLALILLL